MILGETVIFKRSDGNWSNGNIKEIIDDHYVVQWKTVDGRIGTKLVQKLDVKIINYRKPLLIFFLFI